MRINGADHTDRSRYVSQVYQKENESANRPDNKMDPHSQQDSITLSEVSKDVREFIATADKVEASDSDREKIDRIRRAVESGTYPISSKELAEAILHNIAEQNGNGEE